MGDLGSFLKLFCLKNLATRSLIKIYVYGCLTIGFVLALACSQDHLREIVEMFKIFFSQENVSKWEKMSSNN